MAQPISTGTETREQWLGRAIEMMRPEFAAAGAPLPENLAVSCSWPSGNPQTVIGECWVAEASSRDYVEVFISPVLDQVAGIQGVLVILRHELVHAAGRRGHGKEFKALAVELGLTGPMTATVASPELLNFINWTLLPQLGKYPHGAITGRGEILVPPPAVPLSDLQGPVEARGAEVAGTRIHSVRLPGFTVTTEIIFARADERLVMRHDPGESAEPYIAGTLLAVRRAAERVGVRRGLDSLLFEDG
jgi:4-hydroxy-tetrahydrodipicolinate reductase